jgi:hypothetical protein
MTIISRLENLLRKERDAWREEQLVNARLKTGKTDKGLYYAGYRFDWLAIQPIFGILDAEGKELSVISTFESKIEKELEKFCEQYD